MIKTDKGTLGRRDLLWLTIPGYSPPTVLRKTLDLACLVPLSLAIRLSKQCDFLGGVSVEKWLKP